MKRLLYIGFLGNFLKTQMEVQLPYTVQAYQITKDCQRKNDYSTLKHCKDLLKRTESYLSPGIVQLVISPVAVVAPADCCSSIDCTLDWRKFSWSEVCPDVKTIEEATAIASRFIRAASFRTHEVWNSFQLEDLGKLFAEHVVGYLSVPELLPRFLELYQQKEFSLCFQMVCSWIERSIGDLLAHQMKDPSLLPWKLNDLLLIERLENLISADGVFVLKCTIGRMDGLNMRNLLWHGFISDWEFSESYTSFLLSALLTLAKSHKEKIHHRKLLDLSLYQTAISLSELESITKELCDKNFEIEVKELLDRSFFIVPGRETQWIKTLEDCRCGRWYEAALRMFPQLEHSIRRVFVSCNGKYQQLLTAETQELYTTIDVLLARTVRDTTDRNKIFQELGYGISNALLDLFIWDESNRLRDALGHGGVAPQKISPHEVQFLVILSFACALKYDLRNNSSTEYFAKLCSPLRRSFDLIDRYVPIFHPRAKLRSEMHPASAALSALSKAFEELFSQPNLKPLSSPPEDFALLIDPYSKWVQQAESILEKQRTPSRFSTRKSNLTEKDAKPVNPDCRPRELTKLSILRKLTVQNTQTAMELLQRVQSLSQSVADRSAWKRHREQFDYIRLHKDLFLLVLRLLGLLSEIAENAGEKDDATDWPLQWWNLSGALLACVTKSTWKRAVAVCAAAAGVRHSAVDSILSVKETAASRVPFAQYLEQAKCMNIPVSSASLS